MSKIKEYIDNMMDQGIDLLSVDKPEYNAEYEQFVLDKQVREGLEKMHETFETKSETTKSE